MSLDAATVYRLDVLAHEMDRSRSWLVRQAVAMYADDKGVTR
jgi:predicted transcriptional regulator